LVQEIQSVPTLRSASSNTLAPDDRTMDGRNGGSVGVADAVGRRPEARFPVIVAAPPPHVDADEQALPAVAPSTGSTWAVRSPHAGRRFLRLHLLGLDLLAVTVGWSALGFWITGGPTTLDRLAPGLTAAILTLLAMHALGLYRSRNCARRADELWRITVACVCGGAGFALVQWQVAVPGPGVLAVIGTSIVVIGICRSQFSRWLRARRAQGRHLRRVVLVGSNHDAAELRTMLRSEPELGYVVAAVIGDCDDGSTWDDVPSSPSVAAIPDLAAAVGASGILVVPYAVSSATTQRAIALATECRLHVQVWPGFRGVGSARLRSVPISGEPFFYVEPRSSSRWQLVAKRAIDVMGASIALAIASPVIGLAAIAVTLEDRGPVFHRGERVGLHGKRFVAYKLRSMSPVDALAPAALACLNERTDGPLFKASTDPRVTRVGRLLRSSSIDELPQLWNVLKGTMSLVGPRPALPSEVVQFDEDFDRRHSVRPGITGLWQVEARRNPSFHAYRRLDLRYVDNWSLALDLSIMVATVPAVLAHTAHALRRSRRR
jgi:exopolysaccharide biosynthesis polyprenyl glycosylphosphotransferase